MWIKVLGLQKTGWAQVRVWLRSCSFRPTQRFGEQCVQSAQPNDGQQSLDRTTHSGGDPIVDTTMRRECEPITDFQNNSQETFFLQLFVTYGNRLANQIWAPAVPGAEQLLPESTDEQRSKFIKDKYTRGRYRRVHALVSSQSAMDQVCLISHPGERSGIKTVVWSLCLTVIQVMIASLD